MRKPARFYFFKTKPIVLKNRYERWRGVADLLDFTTVGSQHSDLPFLLACVILKKRGYSSGFLPTFLLNLKVRLGENEDRV